MTLRSFKVALAALALFASPVLAQQQVPQFTDPANLRGERVKPRDGRELPIDQGARGLEQMLRKLNTRASLMLIVAHPDDEDGGMLTYYSRGLGARVAVLTLTRGEGGQNAMTGDFEDALGLLRTQELLSADRYLGVDQFFGTEVDFGFSKTKEEAFKKWTHERVLYDAVRSIRLYRPLVIASVWVGGVTDGHGQHQVSGQIAQEAFKAAADPTVFPDMIAEGILPWQALKVYARVPMQSISDKGLFDYATGKYTAPRFENYVTGEITTKVPSSDVVVHEGTVDPILSDSPSDVPRTYVQFARIGLGMQKSQIGGSIRVPPPGVFDIAYHRYGSALTHLSQHESSFFDGIDTSVLSLQSYQAIPSDLVLKLSSLIDHAIKSFDPTHPEASAPDLSDALETCNRAIRSMENLKLLNPIEKSNALHELRIKQTQLNDALILSLGLHLDAIAATAEGNVQQGSAVPVHFTLSSDFNRNLYVAGLDLLNASRTHYYEDPPKSHVGGRGLIHDFFGFSLPQQASYQTTLTMHESGTKTITRPYFSRLTIEQPTYDVSDRDLRNAPRTPSAFEAQATILYKCDKRICIDRWIIISRTVHDGTYPVNIVSPASLSLSAHAQVLSKNASSIMVGTFLYPIEHPAIEPKLSVPANWKTHLAISDVTAPGEMGIVVDAPLYPRKEAVLQANATLHDDNKITEGYRPIGYGDLPHTNYYTPATVRIVPVDLNLPATHNIAYLPGTGDAVPEALASINLRPEILTVADLTPAKLAQYDTVILGVRTYAAHPDLHGAPTQALLEYARNGGNVLVQYQTTEFTAADAPYPLSLGSNEKVVDETDPVQLLGLCDQPGSKPTHPCEQSSMNNVGFLPGSLTDYALLTTPNKITPADFNNWIEERGHGFLESWDSHYTALTETHDPDQDPQRGGLITTPLGKGRWTYCSFALYRQLPEAVPGAFRLFVNLLAPARP